MQAEIGLLLTDNAFQKNLITCGIFLTTSPVFVRSWPITHHQLHNLKIRAIWASWFLLPASPTPFPKIPGILYGIVNNRVIKTADALYVQICKTNFRQEKALVVDAT